MKAVKQYAWLRPLMLLALAGVMGGLLASHDALARGRGGLNGCLRKCANKWDQVYQACMRDFPDDAACTAEADSAAQQCRIENGCAWRDPWLR